eukprot:2094097-Rhodomonas_salina.1
MECVWVVDFGACEVVAFQRVFGVAAVLTLERSCRGRNARGGGAGRGGRGRGAAPSSRPAAPDR